jgi:uncharacterized membrane protein (DUF4010 family)
MDLYKEIIPLGVSILIGALIGIEREKAKQNKKGFSPVGIRTDTLICLFGAVAAFMGQKLNPVLFLVCLGALLAFTISSYIYLSVTHQRVGITTEISTILVFLYGAMAMSGYTQLAVILAIVTVLILSVRKVLHKAVYNINDREFFDTIKFAIIAFIVLPFLPNKSFDIDIFNFLFPGLQPPARFNSVNVLNPYNIWFLIVLVSGISFLGYIMVKALGKNKGIGFAGMVGGLYSSTATSLTLAHKSKEMPKTRTAFVAGITLACGISFIRTFIEIRALNGELFNRVLPHILLMFAYLMVVGIILMFKTKNDKVESEKDQFQTPFRLGNAIKLGAYIVTSLVVAKVLLSYAGINWYYIISAGMAFFAIDDPIVISTSTAAGSLINFNDAKNVILLVLFLNMVQKIATVYFFGNKKLAKPLAAIFGGLLLVTLFGLVYF